MKLQLHSAGDASPLTALLLPQIFPIFSVVAPCQRGASPPSVRRRTFTTDCYAGGHRQSRGPIAVATVNAVHAKMVSGIHLNASEAGHGCPAAARAKTRG